MSVEPPRLPVWGESKVEGVLRLGAKHQPEHALQNAALVTKLIAATLPLQPLAIPDLLEQGHGKGAPAKAERY